MPENWVRFCNIHSAQQTCTRSPAKCAGAMVVGLLLRSVRVFKQFAWLKVGYVKAALSRPTHQYP